MAIPDMFSYASVAVTILVALTLVLAILAITHFPGKPGRTGPVKDSTYESGMVPIGEARGRFHVRFYLVAMLFLLFDVELVFMYPWALVFFRTSMNKAAAAATLPGVGDLRLFLVGEMALFFVILLVGYVYAWRKGIFRWE